MSAEENEPLVKIAMHIHQLQIDAARVRLEEMSVREGVQRLREAAVTWETIGRALGVTKQAAQQRYGR